MLPVVDELAGFAVVERRRAPAEPAARFEHEHARAVPGQADGGAQAGESGADDNRVVVVIAGQSHCLSAISACSGRGTPRRTREDVVAAPLDAPQRLEVHRPHDLGRHQPAPILRRPRLDRPPVELARPAALERDAAWRTGSRHPAGRQVLDRAAGGREVVERQVDAAAREIVLDVAQDVGELQRDAEVQRVVARPSDRGSRRS